MKSASTTRSDQLPEEPANGVTGGLDWASADHAVSVVDAKGRQVARTMVEHTKAGLKTMLKVLSKHGVTEVAIERGDGPVVDELLEAGITVVVISPNQLKNLRSRYGSAGNKDDRFDAYVLADTLRTDRARLRPLTPDTPATTTLRATVRARRDLVKHRVALCNQLRAHLQVVLPGAVGLFRDSTPRSAWPSWPASTPKTVSTGSPRNAWPPGSSPSATAAAQARPRSSPTCRSRPAASTARTGPPARIPPEPSSRC